jgi:predicted small metal-binding protein
MKTIACSSLGGTNPNGEPCEITIQASTLEEAKTKAHNHVSTAHAEIADAADALVDLIWDATPEDEQA